MLMPEQMNKSALLSRIDMAGFAVTDINLYLDTHPDDEEALEYFRHYNSIKEAAMETYAKRFGPLRIEDASPECRWDWITSPWPWEGGDC